MKKILQIFLCAFIMLSVHRLSAQTFHLSNMGIDTIHFTATSGPEYNDIINTSSNNIVLKWSVTSSDFPADWIPHIGVCDNSNCYTNNPLTTPPLQVWNGSAGNFYTSLNYAPGPGGIFDLSLNSLLAGASSGCHYIAITLTDIADTASHAVATFYVINGTGCGTANVHSLAKSQSEDSIVFYPNPAHNVLNVTYGSQSDVQKITIYNLIGKEVLAFVPTDKTGARLEIDNIPEGIYFLRLQDGTGAVIATRKFTRQ